MTAVCWQLGPGVGLGLLLVAGAAGNVLTAAVHGRDHTSVGASTAVFGAIGVLAALRIAAPRRVGSIARKTWVVSRREPGAARPARHRTDADVLAHLFGFLAGGGLGLLAALTRRSAPPAPVQAVLGLAAAVVVAGAWRLAF